MITKKELIENIKLFKDGYACVQNGKIIAWTTGKLDMNGFEYCYYNTNQESIYEVVDRLIYKYGVEVV